MNRSRCRWGIGQQEMLGDRVRTGGRAVTNIQVRAGMPDELTLHADHMAGGTATAEPPSHRDLLQVALAYRPWGWRTFPLAAKDRPLCQWGRLSAVRYTDRTAGRLFGRAAGKVTGLALVTGWPSGGVCVRDFDRLPACRAWAERHPSLAATLPTARTNRGVHVYFRLPAGHPPVYAKGADGELIGRGSHYVVLPPSLHTAGRQTRYRWVANEPHSLSDVPVVDPQSAGLYPEPAPRTQPLPAAAAAAAAASPNLNTSCTALALSSVEPFAPLEQRERQTVLNCVPSGPGQRNGCLWELARLLKTLPHLADVTADDLSPHLEFWHDLAVPHIRTKPLADSLADFARMWHRVRSPAGFGFRAAVGRALAAPFPAEARRYQEPTARKVVAVCAGLQRAAGPGGEFFLSCNTAAVACGLGERGSKTAWRWLKRLVADGLLLEVRPGVPAGPKSRRQPQATRWRWVGAGG